MTDNTPFKTRQDVWDALMKTRAGTPERRAILETPGARDLVLNSGASALFRSGKVNLTKEQDDYLYGHNYIYGQARNDRLLSFDMQEVFSDLSVLMNKRLHGGKPDGIGPNGGLSERTTLEEFNDMAADKLFQERDDVMVRDLKRERLSKQYGSRCYNVIAEKDGYILIDDIETIARNTVIRETREELEDDLGVKNLRLKRGPSDPWYYRSKDDNYILNRWEPTSPLPVYAIDALCFAQYIERDEMDLIVNSAQAKDNTGEMSGVVEMPIFEALKRWGKRGVDADATSEDGRDMNYDFRYPHEFLYVWYQAYRELKVYTDGRIDPRPAQSSLLNKLVHDVQKSILEDGETHRLDFKEVVSRMIGRPVTCPEDYAPIEQVFYVYPGTFANFENIIDDCFERYRAKKFVSKNQKKKTTKPRALKP